MRINFDTPWGALPEDEFDFSLARRPVYIPKVPLPEDIRDLNVEVTKELIAGIQEQANDTVLRQALFLTMRGDPKRPFDNEDFERMVRFTVHFAALLIVAKKYRFEEAVKSAAKDAQIFYSAQECELSEKSKTPLERFLTTSQLDKVDRTLNDFDKNKDILARFMEQWEDDCNGGRRESRNSGYRRDEREDRYGQRRRGGVAETRGYRGWESVERATVRPGREESRYSRDRERDSETEKVVDSSKKNVLAHFGRSSSKEPVVIETAVKPEEANMQLTPAKRAEDIQIKTALGHYTHFIEPHHYVPVWMNGVHVATYQRNVGELFYSTAVIPLDALTEAQKMRYEDHATEIYMKSRTGDIANQRTVSNAAAKRALEDLAQTKKAAELFKEVKDAEPDVPIEEALRVENLTISEILNARSTDDDYLPLAMNYLESIGLDNVDVENSVIHFMVRTSDAWKSTDEDIIEIATQMMQAQGWHELRERFITLREYIPLYNWETLHKRVISHMNEWLALAINSTIVVESFVDDLDDVLQLLTEDGDQYLKAFDTACFKAIRSVTLNGVRLATLGGSVIETPTEVVFGTTEDITLLPLTASDLSFCCVNDWGFIPEGVFPGFHAALARREETRPDVVRHHKLITSDNCIFYVMRSAIQPFFIISRHCNF